MTSIILHIEYLLQRNDCVILPGIGALIVEHIPARLDEEAGVILPPMRMVSLNASINHDDGMLATSIARTEGIKFEEARAILRAEADAIRATLLRDGEFSIGRIGILQTGEENTLHFIPISSSKREAMEMGIQAAPLKANRKISVISSQTTSSASVAEAKTDKTAATEEMDPMCENETATTIIPEGYRYFSDRNYYIAINKTFAKCAAMIAVVLTVAISFLVPGRIAAPNAVKASMNPVETLLNRPESAHPQQQLPEHQPKEVAPDQECSLPTSEATVADHTSYLIVATFHSQAEAEAFIEARRGGTYDLTILKGKNVFRVSAGHGDKPTLQALLNSSEFRAAFSEAWIWNSSI